MGAGAAGVGDSVESVRGPDGMGRVLDQEEAVLVGQGSKPGQIRRHPGKVHGDHDLGGVSVVATLFDLVRGQAQGVWVNVGKAGGPAAVGHAVGRGHEGNGRGDACVARADIKGQAGEVKGHGSVGHGHAVFGSGEVTQGLLEGLDRGPLGEAVRAEDGGDGLNVVFCDGLSAVRNFHELRNFHE